MKFDTDIHSSQRIKYTDFADFFTIPPAFSWSQKILIAQDLLYDKKSTKLMTLSLALAAFFVDSCSILPVLLIVGQYAFSIADILAYHGRKSIDAQTKNKKGSWFCTCWFTGVAYWGT